MNLRQSPFIEILGTTLAAVTVVTSAGMLRKHDLQVLTLVQRSCASNESASDSSPPEEASAPTIHHSDSKDAMSSLWSRCCC